MEREVCRELYLAEKRPELTLRHAAPESTLRLDGSFIESSPFFDDLALKPDALLAELDALGDGPVAPGNDSGVGD